MWANLGMIRLHGVELEFRILITTRRVACTANPIKLALGRVNNDN